LLSSSPFNKDDYCYVVHFGETRLVQLEISARKSIYL
jgi:hypothetical protein